MAFNYFISKIISEKTRLTNIQCEKLIHARNIFFNHYYLGGEFILDPTRDNRDITID